MVRTDNLFAQQNILHITWMTMMAAKIIPTKEILLTFAQIEPEKIIQFVWEEVNMMEARSWKGKVIFGAPPKIKTIVKPPAPLLYQTDNTILNNSYTAQIKKPQACLLVAFCTLTTFIWFQFPILRGGFGDGLPRCC